MEGGMKGGENGRTEGIRKTEGGREPKKDRIKP